jgi:hypothetical protein
MSDQKPLGPDPSVPYKPRHDCLQCRIFGVGSFTAIGIWSFYETYKAGKKVPIDLTRQRTFAAFGIGNFKKEVFNL